MIKESMTREEAIQKAIKLFKLASSTNQHEAALAAQRAQEILLRYEIDAADLQPETNEPIEKFTNDEALDNGSGKRKISNWKSYLASTIARANQCRVFLRGPSICLVGRRSQTQTVRYLYSMLISQIEKLTKENGSGLGKTWCNNYKFGCVDAISEKFKSIQHDIYNQESDDLQKQKIKNGLAVIHKRDNEVLQYMKLNMTLRKAKTAYMRPDNEARQRGQRDGQSIVINSARGGLGSTKPLIS